MVDEIKTYRIYLGMSSIEMQAVENFNQQIWRIMINKIKDVPLVTKSLACEVMWALMRKLLNVKILIMSSIVRWNVQCTKQKYSQCTETVPGWLQQLHLRF